MLSQTVPGTIVTTGANSSLAIPAIQHLFTKYLDHTAILTVRDVLDTDGNTKQLRDTIAQYPNARSSIHELDLANLSAVHDFAGTTAAEIAEGKLPPLVSIICNAYYWNLVRDAESTGDGYEKSLQVIHLAHVTLVLRLLGSFASDGGRVLLLSSDVHWPGKNGLETYPPVVPDDLELLVKPAPDKHSDNFGHSFQKYAVSKQAVVMWMYALNR